LEEQLVLMPTVDEYLDASNRERVRALQALAQRLAPYGFDGGHMVTDHSLRVLAEDTPGSREQDRETVEAWYRSKGRDRASEAEGAKEKLPA
jgi:hypothetical protein